MSEQKSQKEQPIIIKKVKKGGGHGHHGGAWKVAYADFVTAMMAFFIVMWILASSEEVKMQVAEYFEHPDRFELFSGKKKSGPIPIELDLENSKRRAEISASKGEGESILKFDKETTDTLYQKLLNKAVQDSILAQERVEQIGDDLRKRFSQLMTEMPEMEKILSSIKIEMTKEGLRIELIESTESLFFEIGSSKLSKAAINILKVLGREIGKLPNYVDIEGHTDSRSYRGASDYSNWELSTDRANASRRMLEREGLWDGQIVEVKGFADKRLRNPDNPFDMSNRRISILIKHINVDQFLPEL
ncbi:MAG: OmpA family protein [Desulfobulbaceae bacterium]|nr:OmpA family protein [Candidatus Kapabacteria bacterium]MBS3999756.1 OmpA family protein [Desulfobulbaceae bacterium]